MLLEEGSVLGSQIGLHIINLGTKCSRCELHALLASLWHPLDVGLCGDPRQNRQDDDEVDNVHTMTAHRGRSMDPINLNLDIRRRQEVNFTPQPLYTLEKSQVPSELRLAGPQGRSGHSEQKKILPCWESNPDLPVRSPAKITTTRSQKEKIFHCQESNLGHLVNSIGNLVMFVTHS